MNKKIKFIVVCLILLVIVGINVSFAIDIPNIASNESSFFEVNSKELSTGETLEMTIDLLKIDFEQFELVLNSNVELKKIYTDEMNMDDGDIKLDKEGNDLIINIDKEKMKLSKIVLYYQIPENLSVGMKLQINAQAIIEKDDKDQVVNENDVEITIIEKSQEDNNNEGNKNNNNKNEEDKNIENKDEENKNIEDKDEANKNEEIKNPEENINKEQQANETMSKNQNQESMQNMQDMSTNLNQATDLNQLTDSISSMQDASNSSNTKTSVTQTETVTYNGSNNNYLCSLEIDGVELTSDFNKEKLTYFATVEGLETITVTANAEDSSSKVAITGTTLKSGENKVLISVTAENGDVRYYRIYITNN